MSTSTAQVGPDQDFRIINIERRLEQLQVRLDMIERTQQNQAVSASNSSATIEALLQMQRQQIELLQEVTLLQQRVLQLQKTVDQLSTRVTGQEKGEKPEEKKPPEKKGQTIKDKRPSLPR
jgi:hypothetical protein